MPLTGPHKNFAFGLGHTHTRLLHSRCCQRLSKALSVPNFGGLLLPVYIQYNARALHRYLGSLHIHVFLYLSMPDADAAVSLLCVQYKICRWSGYISMACHSLIYPAKVTSSHIYYGGSGTRWITRRVLFTPVARGNGKGGGHIPKIMCSCQPSSRPTGAPNSHRSPSAQHLVDQSPARWHFGGFPCFAPT